MVVNTIERLRELGFTDYEARVYVALITKNPATAYEIGKAAGVPTSKIYEVLGRLSEKGLVMELSESGKKRYVPREPDEFMESYRSRMDSTLDRLSADFSRLRGETNVSYVWNLSDREEFLDQAERMIAGAKTALLISAWGDEVKALAGSLSEREGKVPMALVHFGPPTVTFAQTYEHPIADTLYAERGGRGFSLVADGRVALVATFFEDGHVEGAWSKNPGFVLLAEDYIKHDIYIMKIVRRFNEELEGKFGPGYAALRDVFRDREAPAALPEKERT